MNYDVILGVLKKNIEQKDDIIIIDPMFEIDILCKITKVINSLNDTSY